MAAPFVPVPVPIDRAPRRAAVSVPDRSQSPVTRARLSGSERSVQFSSSPNPDCSSPHLNSSSPNPDCSSPHLNSSSPHLNSSSPHLSSSSPNPDSCSPNPESVPESPGHWQDRPITPTVLGYEVMEERAKFTVYKVLVRKTLDESWVVFRRYTDFSRLNDKLKEMFPGFRLALPPKRWFKDNYETEFLEDRQLGLQAFLQNLVAHKDIALCVVVREFLCLDEPPGPFDSLEESRAFCETLEESNYRLQKELLEKQREINCLKKTLEEKERHIQTLEGRINGAVLTPESPCVSGSDSSVDVESSAAEADQCALQSSQSSVCWCGPAVSSSPPVIQVTPLEH